MTELPGLPDFCWPVDTSCVPDWDAVTDEVDDDDNPIPLYSVNEKARAVALAGQTLRFLTGFRVGGCPITVRPCKAGCNNPTWRTYPVMGFGGSTQWYPVNLGGTWLNIGCGHDGCGCAQVPEIRLYGTASAVTEVKVDGLVLDPSAYRLDRGGRLVRVDGQDWPLCQNLAAPDTEEDTWSVTYTAGAEVDGIGSWVAGILAGEYVAACKGNDCRLPTGVTQIVRAGVTMTIGTGAFPNGMTGIREVDSYVARWNPGALKSPSMVWSPDVVRPRQV